uniref:TPX2_importin domain-containing protein n=1 Tax=Angiostrongylus cantonensis TaxID=6313 RepID=A0A0K0CTW0_ANGCA
MNDAVRNAAVPPIPRRLKRQRFESEPLKEIEGSDRFKKQSEKETETACTQREIISKPEDAPCPQILRPLPCSPSRQIIAKKSCIASNSMSEIGSCAKNTSKANDLRQKVENLSSKGCEIMGSPSHYRKRVQLMPPPLPSKSMNGDYYVKRCTTFLSRNVQETPVTPVSSGPTKRSREETSLIGNQSSKGYEITGSPSQSKKKEQLLTSRLPSKNLNRNYCMEKSTQGHIRNVDETCETALASTSTEHTKVHHEELTTKTSSLGYVSLHI